MRRVTFAGDNRPPSADATATPQFGALPLTVNFDGTGSTDPDTGDSLTYAWDLDGDGQYDDSTAAKPVRTYNSAATVTAGLRVTDKGSLSATDSVAIGAGNEPPQAEIDTPTAALKWAVDEKVQFSGGGTDPQEGELDPAAINWTLVASSSTAPRSRAKPSPGRCPTRPTCCESAATSSGATTSPGRSTRCGSTTGR